jgi:hypothetical protein
MLYFFVAELREFVSISVAHLKNTAPKSSGLETVNLSHPGKTSQ